jgi:hypothetical protein
MVGSILTRPAHEIPPQGATVADTLSPASANIGFLTVLQESSGQLGGYLVTNGWGRPLEFRLSTAVQPNRVHQILYGPTLENYICGDLIGKTLFDKTATTVNLIVTDRPAALDLRLKIDVPVVCLVPSGTAAGVEILPARQGREAVICHGKFVADREAIKPLLERLDDAMDLAEPFGRIREAIAEARKMGVTGKN